MYAIRSYYDPILESPTIVAGIADKAQLFARVGAAAVDMESGVVARAAARAGVPFLAIRAIADAANTGIPRDVLNRITSYNVCYTKLLRGYHC